MKLSREEAKQVLINVASLLKDGTKFMKAEHEQQFRKAYEMAIEALSQDEPLTMTDGTLFIDVPDVTQVKRVIATETGTKFCRQFYMDGKGNE